MPIHRERGGRTDGQVECYSLTKNFLLIMDGWMDGWILTEIATYFNEMPNLLFEKRVPREFLFFNDFL